MDVAASGSMTMPTPLLHVPLRSTATTTITDHRRVGTHARFAAAAVALSPATLAATPQPATLATPPRGHHQLALASQPFTWNGTCHLHQMT